MSTRKIQRTLGLLLVLVLGVCAASADVTNPFEWKSGDANTQYRIPAIVRIDDNTLVAFSDLRGVDGKASGDVGNGHNSIVAKKSINNGATWGNQITILDCSKQADNFAYGDAAVVYDKESNQILLMCCGGTVGFGNRMSTYRAYINPTNMTVTGPDDVTNAIYGLFSSSSSTVNSLFPTSGRMCQSKIVKKGNNYRVYLGLVTNLGSQIIYTDDLGKNWKVLGKPGAALANTVSGVNGNQTGLTAYPNEVKCAELPDGNVWMSARYSWDCKSRGFNIFSYNNSDFTSGSWSAPTSDNCEATPKGGFKMSSSRTNGGIILLPARRVSDKKNVYIAVHTIPYGNTSGTDRYQLGINWKVLRDRNDFEAMKGDLDNDPDVTYPSSKMLTGWKNYTIPEANSYSAYSSIDDNGTTGIDILYEYLPASTSENQGKFYNQVYNTISLSTITNGEYVYATDLDREKFMKVNVQPLPGKVYLIKARHTASDGTVSEYYLHSNFSVTQQGDVTKTDRGDLTAKAHNGTDVPDPTYYWTLSKDGDNGDLYFSSFNGDGYMGWGGQGTDYYTGGTAKTVCCTPLYAQTFKIYGFQHNAWKDEGGTLNIQTGVDGYSLRYNQGNDKRVLLVNHTNTVTGMDGEHEINWSYLTYRSGKPNTGKEVYWTSDLIFTEVSSSNTSGYGTFNQPEFNNTGFPIKFARSEDNAPFMYENDDYNYYATLKTPFPVVIPKDVTVYKVTGITNGQARDKVTLEKFDLGEDRTLPRETPVLLEVDGAKGEGETSITKYVTLGNGKTFTEPDATTGINSATSLAGTLGREVIASSAYNETTGKDGYMYYLLGKVNGKVAFYRLGKNKNGEWAIGKNKAYFKFKIASGSAKAAPAAIDFAFTTTGISNLSVSTSKANDGKVYDLNGHYMGTTLDGLAKGIYIQNGKKIAK